MKNAIFITSLVNNLLFFSVLSIVGIEYRGIDDSLSYVIFCVLFASLSLVYFMADILFLRRFLLNRNTLLFFLLPVFISLIFFMEQPSSEIAKKFYTHYLLFSLTSTYIGIYVANRKCISSMAKWFEVVMIILTAGVTFSIILPFLKNEAFISFAGSSYQEASYISAFAYCLNLFFILFDNRYKLFAFHYFKFYKIMMYILLLLQITGVLVSGGRGGFVVVFVATILFLWLKKRDQEVSIMKILMIILFFILSGLFLLPKLMQKDLFLAGSERVFSYISAHGIDMSRTSSRDIVYHDAIKLIGEKSLAGYGLFGYFDYMPYPFYPHNIFLEILLNGGILFLLLTIFIGVLFVHKLKVIIKKEPSNLLVLTLFIYPIIMLMFSGSYIKTSLFWFVISYVFCYSVQIYEFNNEYGYFDNTDPTS